MDSDTTTSPEALRAEMVDKVREARYVQRSDVEQILRDTPRHEFVPDAGLDAAYNPWQAVITHRYSDGRSLSCASAPFVVAMMLDQLHVQPGNRVLEIGAGTGYNACLLAQLTGRADLVTTIDIDSEVTAQASRALACAGYGDVRVVTGDGALGYPDHAPTIASSPPSRRGTSPRTGGASLPPTHGWSHPSAGAARPAAWVSRTMTAS